MSGVDGSCLVSDEDDRHHRGQSSHTSSSPSPSPSSSSSPLSSLCSTRKRSDSTDEGLTPDGERTPVCALQTISVVTGHHLDLKRKQEDGPDGPTDAEFQRFSEKCSELQCFVAPLSSILQGLQSGRYSQRLSSFQESIAMDRIQRILGILRNPDEGSTRFLGILLKIEEMLQKWFPHIQATRTDEDAVTKRLKNEDAVSSSTHLLLLHTSPVGTLKRPAASPSCSSNVTQDAAVSSSTDSLSTQQLQTMQRIKVRSPCLERLLQEKGSTITSSADAAEPS